MANQITTRADVAKSMYVGSKEVFKKTLKKNRQEEWKSLVAMKTSDGKEEKYETIGNLKAAAVKAEGAALEYGKIIEGTTTTITNETVANGFSVTMEAKEDERWGIVPAAKVEELARTMLQLRERNVASVYDGLDTDVGADGVALVAHNHPLLNSGSVNDNLIEGLFTLENYELACNMFNDWMNHAGEKFDTMPTSIIAHRNRQFEIMAMLNSTNRPFEQSNTKNETPNLKTIFNRYIDKLKVYIKDDTIDSVVFQRRKGLVPEYDYDKRDTFNFYFNVHERYKAGTINPGFGLIEITGKAGA